MITIYDSNKNSHQLKIFTNPNLTNSSQDLEKLQQDIDFFTDQVINKKGNSEFIKQTFTTKGR